MALSKSDFKIASSCSKKLIYKKSNYATMNDANEFLEILAPGGHIVGKYAQLMYPAGIEIKAQTLDEAIDETTKLLVENENIVLFEATVASEGKVVRIDILEKKMNVFNLIEVKSKSHDSEDEESNVKKKLAEYIEDVAFQTMVLKDAFPKSKIHSFLFLPDQSKRTTIEGLAGWFSIDNMVEEKFEMEELPAQNISRFKKPLVEFKYENDPNRKKYVEQLQKDNLLSLLPVDKEVDAMMDEIRTRSDIFLRILNKGIKLEDFTLNKHCKVCEFNLGSEKKKNGYRECWKELTDVNPTIFELYYGGAIGHYTKGWYLDELIAQKKISFWDLDTERFKDSKGNFSTRGQRQLLQFENTKAKTEWISAGLKPALQELKYPLHFIDFECYLGAIPHHKMRPFEISTFQFSCHTITKAGSAPVHSEWINTEYSFPNFRFAEALMNTIGTTGTPLMWSSYENTMLRNILEQMDTYNYSNPALKKWLTDITTDKEQGREGRFVDMNDLTLKHYFHPDMKGRSSIKKTLPAIWNNNPYLHSIPWFKKYTSKSATTLNPYDTLAPIINELENEEVVKDGTGAMRVYNEMMYGTSSGNTERREQLKQLLLQYCELDTASMFIIWTYWMDKCGLSKK